MPGSLASYSVGICCGQHVGTLSCIHQANTGVENRELRQVCRREAMADRYQSGISNLVHGLVSV